jgi:biopolymer transport protein ExbB
MGTTSLFEIFKLGGPLMWFLLAGSVIALGVFVERLLYFHRNSIHTSEFLYGICSLVREKRLDEALERCEDAYGPCVRIIQAALVKRHLPKEELRGILREIAQLQVPKLEANMALLSTIGYIAPLLGLLGTVTGMIQAFMKMNEAMGATPISELAGGIWEALITTAGGLCVAIPAYVAYNFLCARLSAILNDMELCGIEMLQVLHGEQPLADLTLAPENGKKEKNSEAGESETAAGPKP